jgi:hypothetical protein
LKLYGVHHPCGICQRPLLSMDPVPGLPRISCVQLGRMSGVYATHSLRVIAVTLKISSLED